MLLDNIVLTAFFINIFQTVWKQKLKTQMLG